MEKGVARNVISVLVFICLIVEDSEVANTCKTCVASFDGPPVIPLLLLCPYLTDSTIGIMEHTYLD